MNRITSRQMRADITSRVYWDVILANARVFECNQIVRTRFTLGKYDPKLVCAAT